jgi:hypothetical protein
MGFACESEIDEEREAWWASAVSGIEGESMRKEKEEEFKRRLVEICSMPLKNRGQARIALLDEMEEDR